MLQFLRRHCFGSIHQTERCEPGRSRFRCVQRPYDFGKLVCPFSFLDGAENLAVGTFNYSVGLLVVDRCEHCLRADRAAKFPGILVVELLFIVDC